MLHAQCGAWTHDLEIMPWAWPWDQESLVLLSEPARHLKADFVFNQVPGTLSSSVIVSIQDIFISVISDNTDISIYYGSNLSNSLCSNEWNHEILSSS